MYSHSPSVLIYESSQSVHSYVLQYVTVTVEFGLFHLVLLNEYSISILSDMSVIQSDLNLNASRYTLLA